MLAWREACRIYRQASRMWRETVVEQQLELDRLRQDLLDADRTGLSLSMRLGGALERVTALEAELNYLHGLIAWADRYFAKGEDDGGRRTAGNE